MLRPGYLDPSKTSIRQSLLDIFSGAGGAGSRGALNTASRRKATRLEKLFAVASSAPPTPSGASGSTTAVATMGVHGPLTIRTCCKRGNSRDRCPNPALQATMHLMALCNDCYRFHEITTPVGCPMARLDEWHVKHLGHNIEFLSRSRRVPADLNDAVFQEHNVTPWWLEYQKTDFKLAYDASAAYTITSPHSRPVRRWSQAGRTSVRIRPISIWITASRLITVGTTPTVNTVIEAWAYGSLNDTPTYPDVFDGTDSAETVTSVTIKQASLALLAILKVDATTCNRVYAFRPVSLAAVHGGFLPKHHGLFVTHNTVVALHATAGNHVINYTRAYRLDSRCS